MERDQNIEYFRNLAHRGTNLARRCADLNVYRELEGIGVELMEKGARLGTIAIFVSMTDRVLSWHTSVGDVHSN